MIAAPAGTGPAGAINKTGSPPHSGSDAMPSDAQPTGRYVTLERAGALCAARGAKFTPLRRMVFGLFLESGGPLGAYDLIRALELRLQRSIAPPTVYRTLDFLLDQGLLLRIESRNAFVPAAHPEEDRAGAFLLCDHCGLSVEMDLGEVEEQLSERARKLGFRIGRRVVELQGTCPDCQTPDCSAGERGRV